MLVRDCPSSPARGHRAAAIALEPAFAPRLRHHEEQHVDYGGEDDGGQNALLRWRQRVERSGWDLLLTMSISASPSSRRTWWESHASSPARTPGLVPVSGSCVCAVAPPAGRSIRRRLHPPPSPGAYRGARRRGLVMSDGIVVERRSAGAFTRGFCPQGLSVVKKQSTYPSLFLSEFPRFNTPSVGLRAYPSSALTLMHSQLHGPPSYESTHTRWPPPPPPLASPPRYGSRRRNAPSISREFPAAYRSPRRAARATESRCQLDRALDLGSARVSRGNAPLTLPILPGPSPRAPQALRATKAIAPSRVAFAAKPAVRPGPVQTQRSETHLLLAKPKETATAVGGLKLAKTTSCASFVGFFARNAAPARRTR